MSVTTTSRHQFSAAFETSHSIKLGLSATLFPFEVPGLGKIVYEYGFQDACKDGIVPPFDLVNVAVPLTITERDKYLRLSEQITSQLQLVMSLYGSELEKAPDYAFFSRLRQMMSLSGGIEDPTIKKLFVLLFKRASVYYMAERKMVLAEKLTRMLVERGHKKLVVFFERILSAEDVGEDVAHKAASQLRKERISCCRSGAIPPTSQSSQYRHDQCRHGRRSDLRAV